ncbi:MAG TPA: PfkB family carbohydrate kinase [Candidatus Omnitrophota bacterium]|nr:PfkB family carbohydrate kinase [Candidatus Omnitrophota bacterium]
MTQKPADKIKAVADLARTVESLKKKGKRVAHCHGVFDLLHPGHLKHFEAAKRLADVLVVTVTKDEHVNRGPGRPIFTHGLRAESIAALACVDYVAVNEWPTAVETIKQLKPDLYVKGKEYAAREEDVTGKIYDEETAIKAVGGKLVFTDEATFSSTALINKVLAPYSQEARSFLQDLKKRYSAETITGHVQKIKNVKVLVIGDIIVDEYHYCFGMGKTAKDNIIAMRFVRDEQFAGGVLAAANHVAGFCDQVTVLSCLGTGPDFKGFISERLKPNVKTQIYSRKDAPTVIKRRFVDESFLTKLFEICYLDNLAQLPVSVENKVCEYLERNAKNFDMVLVTDFGHGFLTPKIVDKICETAPYLALNVQTNSSNIGFNLVSKFPRADYICIDEPELRLACHDQTANIEQLVKQIAQRMKCQRAVITRGHRGSLAYSKKEGFFQVPVFSKEVVDRIGAGDAFFSITSPCVFQKTPMEIVGVIGNAVGALKVLIVGNRSSVEPGPLLKYIGTLLK